MSLLVTVAVPIYNCEKYLEQCLKNITEQTYKNLQIILINDGSTDNSGEICDEWAKNDKRIEVYHQDNMGIAKTRNVALKNFRGNYLCFVDSDDYIEIDYIERLLKDNENYDVIVSAFKKFGNREFISELTENSYMNKQDVLSAYMYGDLKNYFYGPVGKLYARELILGNMFKENLIVAEDIVFNLNILKNANKIKCVNYPGYCIRVHNDSTTNTIDKKYSALYEHDYKIIMSSINEAESEVGFDDEWLSLSRKKRIVSRYYNEVLNLFQEGSPYLKAERKQKIKEIHMDKEFCDIISKTKFKQLSKQGKIAKISCAIKNTHLTYLIFSFISKR